MHNFLTQLAHDVTNNESAKSIQISRSAAKDFLKWSSDQAVKAVATENELRTLKTSFESQKAELEALREATK